jgi:hypothetical protein
VYANVSVFGIRLSLYSNIVVESLYITLHHTGASSKDDVVPQANSEVDIALVNGAVSEVDNTLWWGFHSIWWLLVNVVK